jgi:hypothetical protein
LVNALFGWLFGLLLFFLKKKQATSQHLIYQTPSRPADIASQNSYLFQLVKQANQTSQQMFTKQGQYDNLRY